MSRSCRFCGQHVRRGKRGYDADEGTIEQMYEVNEEMCRVERKGKMQGPSEGEKKKQRNKNQTFFLTLLFLELGGDTKKNSLFLVSTLVIV